MKNTLMVLAIVTSLGVPFISSAESIADTQAKIDAMQAQIQTLLEQIKTLQATVRAQQSSPADNDVGQVVAQTAQNIVCPALTRTLTSGAQGDDVRELQKFLSSTGDYTYGEITGYFGPATAEAVKKWQSQSGILLTSLDSAGGFGVVGPRTRTKILEWCKGKTTQPSTCVQFIPPKCEGGVLVSLGLNAEGCSLGYECRRPVGVKCGVSAFSVEQACTSGDDDLSWYRNAHVQCYDGTTQTLGDATSCKSSATWQKYANDVCTNHCSEKTGTQPTISGVDAPKTLAAGQVGTWTVKATSPNDNTRNFSYSVVWGDESIIDKITEAARLSTFASFQSSATFTHAYTRPGTYHPTFKVSNGKESAVATASVVVTSVASNGFSAFPLSGGVPLTVTFSGVGNVIDFGDGATGTTFDATSPVSMSHTYTHPGTYTATSNGGTVTITVDSPSMPTSGTLNATPTSGPAPLEVAFANVQGSISFGDGESYNIAPSAGSITHTYRSPGRYIATSDKSWVAITVSDPKSNTDVGTLTASPASGAAPLTVSFSATSAKKYEGLFIDFGDGTISGNQSCSTSQNSFCRPTTHTYQHAGKYTITLIAVGGGTRSTIATVIVTVSAPRADAATNIGNALTALQAFLSRIQEW